MIFDSVTHKVIIESMNETEAKAFMMFLFKEDSRHITAINIAKENNKHTNPMSGTDVALKQFEESAILRHQEDIEGTKLVRLKVKYKFGWE